MYMKCCLSYSDESCDFVVTVSLPSRGKIKMLELGDAYGTFPDLSSCSRNANTVQKV